MEEQVKSYPKKQVWKSSPWDIVQDYWLFLHEANSVQKQTNK